MTIHLVRGLAAVAAAVLLTASCSSSNSPTADASKGVVSMRITASGAVPSGATGGAGAVADGSRGPTAATIVISAASARMTDGTLVPFVGTFPHTVDVLALAQSGGSVTLPADTLPAGSYDAIEITITQASITLQDGTIITITPPGAGWQKLIPITFDVVAGEETVITLRLHCDSSFRFLNGRFEFDPDIDCDRVDHGRH